LSDSPSKPTQFKIPNGVIIPAKGFLLVWADNAPERNSLSLPTELHVNFALARGGESICLFAPDGTIIDSVTFGPQQADVSEGRYPDGGSTIRPLTAATPGTTNAPPVSGANLPPVIETIPDKIAVVGQELQFTVVASDPDQPIQTLTYEIVSGPAGANINSATGVFTWTPSASNVGTNTFVIRVVDNGQPPLDATTTFRVVVMLTGNQPPVIEPIGNKAVDEGTLLTFTVRATDDPSQTLRFSLGAGAPAGAAIDQSSGVFTWTPSELQGPGIYSVSIIVTDNGTPVMSATAVVEIVVREVNTAPVLLPVANQTVYVGERLTVQLVASDSDVPVQKLTYSVVSAPSGVSVDANSGLLSWTPGASAIGTNTITVKVSDDGEPSLSSERTFSVVVVSLPKLEISRVGESGNQLRISFDTLSGKQYILQTTTNLGIYWDDFTNSLNGTGSKLSITNSTSDSQRKFYRLKISK
jgi:hypothetical protein